MHSFIRRLVPAAATAGLVSAMLLFTVPALAISVTLNGNNLSLNPPPVERAGRVFVPLRGVFERLGASVVYSNGQINASGRGHNISLNIGSNQATVDGQNQTLDVAPFIIGASTYVPLRFVSQALGATVNWDGNNQLVALTQYGPGGGNPYVGQQPSQNAMQLTNVSPQDGTSVRSNHPTIRADFSGAVDPNSVRVRVDGNDVTNETTRSQNGIVYAPGTGLQAMQHRVTVTGNDQNGTQFRQSWTFTSGTGTMPGNNGNNNNNNPQARTNFLNLTQPADGASVGSTFTLQGRTVPNGQVHIVAGSAGNVGGFFTYNNANFSGDVRADGSGYFSQTIALRSPRGSQVGLTITSTDPQTNETSQRQLTLHVE